MRVSWVIEGRGAGCAAVGSAEDACTALREAVTDAYGSLDPGALAVVLGGVYGLRLAMITDGTAAVGQGREWHARTGGILVSLSPDV